MQGEMQVRQKPYDHEVADIDFNRWMDEISQRVKKIGEISSFKVNLEVALFGSKQKYEYTYQYCDEHSSMSFKIIDGKGKIGSITITVISQLSDDANMFVQELPTVIALEFKSRWIRNVVDSLLKPIPLELDSFAYNRRLAQTMCDASGARYVFIRKHTASSFDCVGYYDRENPLLELRAEATSISDQNYTELYKYLEDFLKNAKEDSFFSISKIEKKDVKFRHVIDITKNEELLTAITLPLMTGGECAGIISLIFDDYIPICKMIKEGLFLVANHGAIALEHYEKNRHNKELTSKNIRKFLDLTNFDILQGFRHSARNSLGSVKGDLSILKDTIPNKDYELLESGIDKVAADLDNMSALTSKIDHAKEAIDLLVCFLDAKRLLQRILKEHDIQVRYPDKGIYIWGYGNAIKYAFFNMMYNSYQSLVTMKKSDEKKITFTLVHSLRDRVLLDISDNGPGFIPKKGVNKIENVWEIGATTKEDGTGYGLSMVRDIFQNMHNGTCNIAEHKKSFRIRIEIFKYSNQELEKMTKKELDLFNMS